MIEKDKTQKNRQAKDIRSSKKALGTMQANYTKPVWEYLLHLPSKWTGWKQLANGTYVAQGKCGCVFEVRLENTPTPMLQLQYKPWGEGCRLLLPNVKRNRSRRNGKTPARQKSNSKGLRPLSETPRGIPKPLKRPTNIQGILAKR